jgi:aspartate-semialdehyde dehydrogenase
MEHDIRSPRRRIPAAVLGATGAVGQRFVQLLDDHPWFQVVALTGSDRAVGQKYAEACHWLLSSPMPEWAREMTVVPTLPEALDLPVAFSALPSRVAQDAEPLYAQHGTAVCSNASAFRAEPDVPLVLPEVNPEHTTMLPLQRQNRGWKGFIVTNANCTITGLTITLKALVDGFGLQRAFVVSMQAVSGAGYPGIASMDILGNVVPYIGDEEEKMEHEPLKILGTVKNGEVEPCSLVISAHANRVPVSDGHMVCLSVELAQPGSIAEVTQALRGYLPPEIVRDLPSTPPAVIQVMDEPDRPQPRLDMMTGKGMTTVVGRLRPDPLLDYKMVILSHNTIRGAAGGSIYNAELLVAQGYIQG